MPKSSKIPPNEITIPFSNQYLLNSKKSFGNTDTYGNSSNIGPTKRIKYLW
jgi:hypothetical protein